MADKTRQGQHGHNSVGPRLACTLSKSSCSILDRLVASERPSPNLTANTQHAKQPAPCRGQSVKGVAGLIVVFVDEQVLEGWPSMPRSISTPSHHPLPSFNWPTWLRRLSIVSLPPHNPSSTSCEPWSADNTRWGKLRFHLCLGRLPSALSIPRDILPNMMVHLLLVRIVARLILQ